MMIETLCDFAVSCYARPGVAACCLRLQDSIGADINMLLTATWLAEQGLCWQRDQVRALITACADWREACVLPLRGVRRYLKQQAHLSSLYTPIKALELDAEIQQLHLLYETLQSMTLTMDNTMQAGALATNLQTYFDCIASHPKTIADVEQKVLIETLSGCLNKTATKIDQ